MSENFLCVREVEVIQENITNQSYMTDTSVKVADAAALTPGDPLFLTVEQEIDRLFGNRSIQRVLLVLPPDSEAALFHFQGVKNRRYLNYPAYGLGVLAAHLRRDGVDVRIVNLNNEIFKAALHASDESMFDYEEVIMTNLGHAVSSWKPDLVGLSAMFSVTHKSAIDCCLRVRSIFHDTPIIVGGLHFTSSFQDTVTRKALLKDLESADLLIMYEAEVAFRNFVQVVNRQATVSQLSQVVFIRMAPIILFDNRAVPSGDDLDVIPALDLLVLDEISANGNVGSMHFLVPNRTRIATSLANRGCRGSCTFCSVRQFNGVGVRSRSVRSVVDELLMLKNEYGVQHVCWLDDDFLFGHRRALELFNEIVRRDVGLTWDTGGIVAASCTEELISGAEAAGCIGLFVGMESGNPQILKTVKKPGNVRNFLHAAGVLRRYEKINSRVFLMFGFPGETFRMIKETIDVAREMDLDWCLITPLQKLPNTVIYDSISGISDCSSYDFAHSPYSRKKQDAIRIGDILMIDFERVFDENELDTIPSMDQYDAIWSYMHYHLNYKRLFLETRIAKLSQAFKYVDRVAHFVIPRSGFAWYYRNYLFHRIHDYVDKEGVSRLTQLMDEHGIYRDRFQQLAMPLDWFRGER
jgi:radical SAM superfamily enzyme YgiQ (UPF0313 family)